MRVHGTTVRGARRFRGQALAALALCGTLALTGCNGDNGDDGAGAAGTKPSASPATPEASPTPSAPAAPAGGAAPSATAKKTPAASPAASPATSPATTPPAKPKPPAPEPACGDKMPISPDEIAVYRYTPEGGFHSLIVKHGNWTCPTPGLSTATFKTVGTETFIPIAEDAKITAITPIVASTVSKPITLHELTEWLIAHPDKGLVFRYHLGAKGVIDTLDQEFTP